MKKQFVKSALLCTVLVMTTLTVFSQSKDLKSEIEKINKEIAEAMIAGNSEVGFAYYTQDAISMPNNAPMLKGLDAIKKSNEQMKEYGVKIKSFKSTTLELIESGDMIVEIGQYEISIEVPGMSEPVNDHGKYLTLWENQKGGLLKMKVEIWNTDIQSY